MAGRNLVEPDFLRCACGNGGHYGECKREQADPSTHDWRYLLRLGSRVWLAWLVDCPTVEQAIEIRDHYVSFRNVMYVIFVMKLQYCGQIHINGWLALFDVSSLVIAW